MESTAMATVQAGLAEPAKDRQLEAIKRILSQRTPPDEIRVRDGRGGQKLKYTDGAYVIRTLNDALGWDWDFVADNEELLMNGDRPFEVKCRGTLTVRMDGRTVTKTQYGCQPIEMKRDGTAPVSIGDCYKGAATDALKKCASMLGIALDLYDSDYKPEKYADPTPAGNGQSTKATSHILAQVKQLGWDAQKVGAWMEEKFNYLIETDDLSGVFDSFDVAEQRKIFAALKAEAR